MTVDDSQKNSFTPRLLNCDRESNDQHHTHVHAANRLATDTKCRRECNLASRVRSCGRALIRWMAEF